MLVWCAKHMVQDTRLADLITLKRNRIYSWDGTMVRRTKKGQMGPKFPRQDNVYVFSERLYKCFCILHNFNSEKCGLRKKKNCLVTKSKLSQNTVWTQIYIILSLLVLLKQIIQVANLWVFMLVQCFSPRFFFTVYVLGNISQLQLAKIWYFSGNQPTLAISASSDITPC